VGDIVDLTDKPVRHTDTDKQPLRNAMDVSRYDELDLLIHVQHEASGGGVVVRILTAMQKESEQGWVTAATFPAAQTDEAFKINVQGFLRYVRYELVTSGVTTTFVINGMGRRWG
jgi:hypothetical protein